MSKATDALRKAEESKAWSNAEAFIIIKLGDTFASGKMKYGKVKVRHSATGTGKTEVFVWDIIGTPVQYSHASGYGYNKVSSAMSNIIFDGIQLLDNGRWKSQLEDAGYQVIQAI